MTAEHTTNVNELSALELARRFLDIGQVENACQSYEMALKMDSLLTAEEKLECAMAVLQLEGNYQYAYLAFCELYNAGAFREDVLNILLEAFYRPNVNQLKNRYEKNCKRLKKYPYLFRKDFVPFEELPVLFFPFDDNGYLPFYIAEERFGDYVDFNHPVISQNFFHDLDKPIFAADVFSQYELEYLNDNVRKSEWVAKENHIYLHYTDWAVFCAYLQCLDWKELVKDEKFVLLIEDEAAQYPIDFKVRFGLDYSQYTPKPIGVREIHRLIWHTQLSTHNGGDFFNEIFYEHPNLVIIDSIMMYSVVERVEKIRELYPLLADETVRKESEFESLHHISQLHRLKNVTDKDILVALFMDFSRKAEKGLDPTCRIAPALFFQPHFHNIVYQLALYEGDRVRLVSDELDEVQNSPLFHGFKYIKTFTPMRRMTTSYAASVKFILRQFDMETGEGLPGPKDDPEDGPVARMMPDVVLQRVANRSFMVAPQDRLFADSVLVRFEDGKLNPTATFTALAAFLDIPYTESMTYCSTDNGKNQPSVSGNVGGFDPATVYRTYDEFGGDTERCFLEYCMRDAYQAYGYDFHYYDGRPVDEAVLRQWSADFTTFDAFVDKTYRAGVHIALSRLRRKDNARNKELLQEQLSRFSTLHIEELLEGNDPEAERQFINESTQTYLALLAQQRLLTAQTLQRDLKFVNEKGQPLRMMPLLKLDPELLEQPLYH